MGLRLGRVTRVRIVLIGSSMHSTIRLSLGTINQYGHKWILNNLFRSATVKKFMVGYEMLANPQRDLTAEQV